MFHRSLQTKGKNTINQPVNKQKESTFLKDNIPEQVCFGLNTSELEIHVQDQGP